MSRQAEARALDGRIMALIARGARAPFEEAAFDALARDLLLHQVAHGDVMGPWCVSQGVNPERIASWRDIPPLPALAFKSLRVAAFPPGEAVATWWTSGTTGAGRGAHEVDTIDLYREGSLAAFEAALLPDGVRLPALILAPSPAEAPHSSLSAMCGWVAERFAAGAEWLMRGALDEGAVIEALERQVGPVLLLGTSFAFVMLCDRLAGERRRLRLPPGSRAMETGGTKGRTREVERAELVDAIVDRLGLLPSHVVNEYGMTELSSQLYTGSLAGACGSPLGGEVRRWWAPPWLRARALDPDTLEDVPAGRVGVLALVDVLNRGSALAVRTADRGIVHLDGSVEVLGRARGVEARGCSLVHTPRAAHVASAEPPAAVTDAAEALITAREAIAGRSVASIAESLGRVSARWLDPADPLRREALATLPETTGLSPEVLAAGLDLSFGEWTTEALRGLVRAELGADEPLDRWQPWGTGLTRPTGPRLTLVVGAGNLPAPLALDVSCALLLRSAVLVKPPSDEPRFAALVRRAILEVDPDLGACVAVRSWPGGSVAHEDAALAVADAVIATGEDEAVLALRRRAPLATRFVARGARLSVGLIAREAVADPTLPARMAVDTLLWDQRGCLSPVAWLVEGDVDRLAVALDEALAALHPALPHLPGAVDARIAALEDRAAADVRQMSGEPVRRVGRVVVDGGPLRPLAGRQALLHPVGDLREAPAALAPWRGRLSNVVLALPPERQGALVASLLSLAPTRLCAVGAAQQPPANHHHDGDPVLLPLVRWTDLQP